MTMVGSLKTLQVNISSLIMKVIPLVNNYKWKAYHILDQKTCIKISLTPDLTEIKLWTEGGLGEALGVLKTTFSFSDSREGSPNSTKLLYSQFLLQQKNTDEKQ